MFCHITTFNFQFFIYSSNVYQNYCMIGAMDVVFGTIILNKPLACLAGLLVKDMTNMHIQEVL